MVWRPHGALRESIRWPRCATNEFLRKLRFLLRRDQCERELDEETQRGRLVLTDDGRLLRLAVVITNAIGKTASH